MIPSVGSGLTTTPTRQPHNAKGRGGMGLSACKPQRVPSSPAAAAAAEKKANNGDMTDSEALRRASQVSGLAIRFGRLWPGFQKRILESLFCLLSAC